MRAIFFPLIEKVTRRFSHHVMPKQARAKPRKRHVALMVAVGQQAAHERRTLKTSQRHAQRQHEKSYAQQKLGAIKHSLDPHSLHAKDCLTMPEQELIPIANGFAFRGMSVVPGIPDGTVFQVPTAKERKAKRDTTCGFALKSFRVPIQIGPCADPLFNGTEWADKINAYLESQSDALPKVPCLILVVGPLGAGKSTIISNLVKSLCHPEAFTVVRVAARALRLDPVFMQIVYECHPDVHIDSRNMSDVAYMKEMEAKVEKVYEPILAQAMRGKYRKAVPAVSKAIPAMWQPYDDPVHPGFLKDGRRHGNVIYFPNALDPKPHHGFDRLNGFEKQYSSAPLDYSTYTQPIEGNPIAEAYRLLSTNPLLQSSLNVTQRFANINTLSDNPLVAEAPPTLMLFDDAANRLMARDFVTETFLLRHIKGSAIMSVQKLSTLPTGVRTVATGIIVSKINDERELEFFEEEYGALCDNNFRGYYEAATQTFEQNSRDFLYIDLRERRICRGFKGELIPVACQPVEI